MRKGVRIVSPLILIVALLATLLPLHVAAQPVGPFYSVETLSAGNGAQLERATIAGPAAPPPGFELERASVTRVAPGAPSATLNVPAYDWVYGCSAVSASMIAAYYDQNGLPNIYTGPTNGGVMPMDSSVWPRWTDGVGAGYPSNPLIATMIGLEGRTARGSIEDYWIEYNSGAADPFIAGGWTQHAYGEAIGDYMKTSQSTYANVDGATSFWNYNSSAPLPCADMPGLGIADDGTYGRMEFYQARGYTVSECFNQKTDNTIAGGFTFSQYKQYIDAGKPVLINLAGHSVVGVGYADPATVYLHDTWDYLTHEMTWGGSYAGMAMQSVSVATPAIVVAPAAGINDVTVTEGNSGTVNATFTVSLSAAAPYSVSIQWATADGAATAGTDYTAASGTVSFATGESSKPVTVQVKGDATYEPNETFYVNLSNPSGATIGDGQGVGTINNDDAAPKVVHVGDLDATKSTGSKGWSVTVTITVHDVSEKLMGGASVSGAWSGGATGTGSCSTRSGTGVCSITKSNIPNAATSETFTVTKITLKGYTYDSARNHDPDGESTGTVITVTKP